MIAFPCPSPCLCLCPCPCPCPCPARFLFFFYVIAYVKLLNVVDTSAYAGCPHCWLRPCWCAHLTRQVWAQSSKFLAPGHPGRDGGECVRLKSELQAKLWLEQRQHGDSKDADLANAVLTERTGFQGECQLSRLPYFRRELCCKVESLHVVYDVLKRLIQLLGGKRTPRDIVHKEPNEEREAEKADDHDRRIGAMFERSEAKVFLATYCRI